MLSDNETVDPHFHFMLMKFSMPCISISVKNVNMDPISMEYIMIYFFRNDSVKHTFLLDIFFDVILFLSFFQNGIRICRKGYIFVCEAELNLN